MSSTDTLIVSEEEKGLRLDRLLALRFPEYSRTYFQFLIEKHSVLVNGIPFKKREKPQVGDEIEVCFLLLPEISLEPQNIPLDILYEDDHILAVNKPSGMVVHPAPGHFSHTFVNALLYHCKGLSQEPHSVRRPGIVHRLDKDTSGILLAAKTTDAHQALVSLFCHRQIEKHYLAICSGNPGICTINAPIKRHPIHRQEMTIAPLDGKEAISHCKTLKTNGKFSLVDVQLVTGRTHQIRVHLRHIGSPILGDPLYGIESLNKKFNINRQLLHAHTLAFIHPFTGAKMVLKASLPEDFSTQMEKIYT
jgi:23S rRNA pseudouridine1911/1915/1917 synthase